MNIAAFMPTVPRSRAAAGNGQRALLAVTRAMYAIAILALAWISVLDCASAQPAHDKVMRASATVQESPPTITLSWPASTGTGVVYIYRKTKDATTWGAALTAMFPDPTEYEDTDVAVGETYEYLVYQQDPSIGGRFGYVYAGIQAPLVENRGTVVLVVDTTYAAALATELTRLELDLVGDGWTVVRHDVDRTETVPNVKALIQADYTAEPADVKAVLLFGHVPVPYSGDINPDAHPDHQGAWPADVYYGDMDGVWTDSTVNTTSASRSANHNVPGDGKFDQSYIPSELELMVGRVDLADMPVFSMDEENLLRQYLDKNHAFRHADTAAQRRALVRDNLTSYSEGFAQSGWRFASLFGASNVAAGAWSDLLTGDYLWAYGCGPGNYTTVTGVVSSSDYAGGTYQAMFQMLFGSYFGDWDNQNNVLRAPLCNPTYGLAACWVGRPNWHAHHMALGETIGYAARLSTTFGTYSMGNYASQVHIALMGDPTLRLHYIVPPSDLAAAESGSSAELSWTASPATGILGYHVYRSASSGGPFTRVNAELIEDTSYTDPDPLPGESSYMVRAVRLEESAGGTYYNASTGVFTAFLGAPPPAPVITSDGGNGAGGDYATNSPDLLLEGTCDSSLVTVEVNGSTVGVTYTAGETVWSYIGTLSEGANVFEVTGTDSQPRTSDPDTITVTLDTAPPAVPVVTTDGGNGAGADFTTANAALTLDGTCASDTVVIRVNGSTDGVSYTSGATSWTFSTTLSEGATAFAVTAADDLGNTSAAATITVTLDTTVPPAPVISTDGGNGPGADFVTTTSELLLEGTCDTSLVSIEVNGSTEGVTYTAGSTTWSYVHTLVEGANVFDVTGTGGNRLTSEAATITVTLDETPYGRPQGTPAASTLGLALLAAGCALGGTLAVAKR